MNIGITKAIATQVAKDEIAKVGTGVDNVARTGVNEVKSQLDDIGRTLMYPYFIDGFATFNNYGYGIPNGLSNYPSKNYVCSIQTTDNKKEVKVLNGNISHGGGIWACVIKDDLGNYINNKVVGVSGDRFILLDEIDVQISNGFISNLHDENLGQHYSEFGYFSFAQNIVKQGIEYSERNQYFDKFSTNDTSGGWVNNGFIAYNTARGMKDVDGCLVSYGSNGLYLNVTNNDNYIEWEVTSLNKEEGYLEAFVGTNINEIALVEVYIDDVLTKTIEANRLTRVICDFNNANKGRIKIKPKSYTSTFKIYVGDVTWFKKSKYNSKPLTEYVKPAYLGDSWGQFQNKATSRELSKLLSVNVTDYSRHAHSSIYAKLWFEEYIIKNKHDLVFIEYFTNDFNSINGADLGNVLAPNGESYSMNINNIQQYEKIMCEIIEMAINNGIQPIVMKPFATNSEVQTQDFANKSQLVWQGKSLNPKTLSATKASINEVCTSNVTNDKDILIKSSAINSASRNGVVIDSGSNLTGGSIAKIRNNGVDKFNFKFDGTLGLKQVNFQLITNKNDVPLDNTGRGTIYCVDESVNYNGDDNFYVVVRLSDGTFKRKKIQLIDA